MTLYLVRGLPGSGKSTFAYRLATYVLEADQYFLVNGIYQYNPKYIKEAHDWCQLETRHHLRQGHDVAVANTFTQRWEMKPYYDMCSGKIIEIIISTPLTDEELAARCIHKVPFEKINEMRRRWEL